MPPRNSKIVPCLWSSLEDGELEHTLKPEVMLFKIVCLKSNLFPTAVSTGLKSSFPSRADSGVPDTQP